ncbi:hypothetical protein O5821_21400 [Escherichia coli]|nr:hypothetical protein [Escherichia coli]
MAGQRVRLSAQPTAHITIGDAAYTDNNGYAYVNLLSTQHWGLSGDGNAGQ